MNVTQEFVDACKGKTFVAGRLENAEGNWWAARINGAIALVGWEVAPLSEAAATVLINQDATFVAGNVDLNGDTYTFGFDNEGVLIRI